MQYFRPWFLVFTDPRADHQPLTEAYGNLPPPLLCVRQILHCGYCHPMQQQGSSLSGSSAVDAQLGSSAHRGTLMGSHASSHDILKRYRQISLKRLKRKSRQQLRRCDWAGVSGKWTTSAPEFTSPQPEVLDWSQGVPVPSVHSAVPHWRMECSACRCPLLCSSHCLGPWNGGRNCSSSNS